MDLNIVSSKHAKDVFLNAKFEERNQQTNQVVRIIAPEKPIEVLFEGVDLDIYKLLDKIPQSDLYDSLNSIPESFAYLFVGHWLQGDLGEDRKNVGLLIKAFYEIFKNKKQKPALILKASILAGASYVDREEILKRIKQIRKTVASKDLPNIYLLHGEFKDEEINELYNHPKGKHRGWPPGSAKVHRMKHGTNVPPTPILSRRGPGRPLSKSPNIFNTAP